MAMRDSLLKAKKKGFTIVEVEGDSKLVRLDGFCCRFFKPSRPHRPHAALRHRPHIPKSLRKFSHSLKVLLAAWLLNLRSRNC
ncbi:hypothetical protein ACLB2K_002153 [Fragaria x ananassa]